MAKHSKHNDDYLRVNGYITIYYYPNRKVKAIINRSPELGNDLPSVIKFYESGKKQAESWGYNHKYNQNFQRKYDLPIEIWYHENGQIYKKMWNITENYTNDLPSVIIYHDNGIKQLEYWHINGKQHREYAPAYVKYDKNGKIIKKEYYYNNHDITGIVKKLFRCIPNKLTKDQCVLLKLSIPEEYF